jgi:DNA-binding IclR family transcriptional regulator
MPLHTVDRETFDREATRSDGPATLGVPETRCDRESGLATSAGKTLAVLDAFRGGGVLLGVTQIADRARIAKSTAHRLLAVLVEHGYVERDGARYRLAHTIFELGNMVSECRPRSLRAIAAPFMSDLYENTHATIHLAVLDELDVLYVEKIFGHHSIDVPSQVGGRLPALCTALGKAMVAFSSHEVRLSALRAPIPRLTSRTVVNPMVIGEGLDTVRRTGVAHDIEGACLGAQCIAAPVISARTGMPLAALSLSFSVTSRIPGHVQAQLQAAAGAISAAC